MIPAGPSDERSARSTVKRNPSLRFIYVEFEPGVSEEDYDKFSEAVMDLADEIMARRLDCDNDIWVSGGGGVTDPEDIPKMPEQPYGPGAFCGTCGHFAERHGPDGCTGVKKPCRCEVMQWNGYRWPRPWLPAPEGLRSS